MMRDEDITIIKHLVFHCCLALTVLVVLVVFLPFVIGRDIDSLDERLEAIHEAVTKIEASLNPSSAEDD